MINNIHFTDNEITLKHLDIKDTACFFKVVNDNREELEKWLPFVPFIQHSIDAKEYIRQLLELMDEDSTEVFSVFYNDQWVGMVVIKDIDWYTQKAELGYWISPEYYQKGIGTTALKLTIEYCFNNIEINRLQIKTAPHNNASLALIQKFPFQKEGIEREAEKINERFLDLIVFSCLASDYQ